MGVTSVHRTMGADKVLLHRLLFSVFLEGSRRLVCGKEGGLWLLEEPGERRGR